MLKTRGGPGFHDPVRQRGKPLLRSHQVPDESQAMVLRKPGFPCFPGHGDHKHIIFPTSQGGPPSLHPQRPEDRPGRFTHRDSIQFNSRTAATGSAQAGQICGHTVTEVHPGADPAAQDLPLTETRAGTEVRRQRHRRHLARHSQRSARRP